MPRLFALLALASCVQSVPVIAGADPIVITGGSLTAVGVFGPTTFTLTGDGFSASGGREPGFAGPACAPCVPGDPVSFSSEFSGGFTLGSGPATVNGVSYTRVFYAGVLNFAGGSVTFPTGGGPTVTLMTPFVLSLDPSDPSFLQGFATQAQDDLPLFSVSVTGQGTASALYTEGPPGLYNFSHVTYSFGSSTPVPEPTSLFLLGSGLVGAAVRYWYGRARIAV